MINYKQIKNELDQLCEDVLEENISMVKAKTTITEIFAEINDFLECEDSDIYIDLFQAVDLCVTSKRLHEFGMNVVHLKYAYSSYSGF